MRLSRYMNVSRRRVGKSNWSGSRQSFSGTCGGDAGWVPTSSCLVLHGAGRGSELALVVAWSIARPAKFF